MGPVAPRQISVKHRVLRVAETPDWPALAVLLVALAVRLYRLDGQSLWYDEGTSAALATRSLATIAANAADDIHPPLYYWLLAAWCRVFGDGVFALRSLSAIFGTATVGGVLAVGRMLFSKRAALMAGLAAALSPYLVWYSQEARMYALAAALATALVWLALDLLRSLEADVPNRLPSWVALGALGAAALFTHYFAGASTIAACNAIAALGVARASLRARSVPWGWIGKWAATELSSLALWLVWLAYAWGSLTSWPATSPPFGIAFVLREEIATLFAGAGSPAAVSRWWLVALVLLLLGVAARARDGTLWPSVQILAWLAVPPLLLWALSLSRPGWHPKQLATAAPAFELLLGVGIAQVGTAVLAITSRAHGRRVPLAGRFGVAIAVALVLAPRVSAIAAMAHDPKYQRDDYRTIARVVAALSDPNDAVILDAPTQIEVFEYYDRGKHKAYPLPSGWNADPREVQTELAEIAARHDDLFAVLWAVDERDPERAVETWLDRNRYKAFDRWYGNVRLALWAEPDAELVTSTAASGARFGDEIALQHLGRSGSSVSPGEVFTLRAVWSALRTPSADYTVFTQLLSESDRIVAQRDMKPVGDSSRTSSWSAEPGSEVVDLIGLLVPPGTAPGRYRLVIGLYHAQSARRLAVTTAKPEGAPSDALELAPVTVR